MNYKTVYYLSYQDGRVNDREYDTYEEALRVLGLMGTEARGICVMSRSKEIKAVRI